MPAASHPSSPNAVPWLSGLLSPLDRGAAALALASKWLEASTQERECVANGWSWGVMWSYPRMGRLACTVGERGSSLERIQTVLIMSWLDARDRSREQTILYCELYHSCVFAGLDPTLVFSEVAQTLPNSGGDPMLRFLERSEADKALEAFGFVASRDNNGEWELRAS